VKWGRSEALGADVRGCLHRQGCRLGCRWCDHGGVDDAVAVDEDAGGPDAADAGAVDDGDGGASAAGVGRPLLAAKKVSARRPSASRMAVRSSSECIENEDNRVQSYSLKCNPRSLVLFLPFTCAQGSSVNMEGERVPSPSSWEAEFGEFAEHILLDGEPCVTDNVLRVKSERENGMNDYCID